MSITVVIPTYNEARNLPVVVKQLLTLPLDNVSVLVIDDNSPDGTGEVAESLAKEWPGRVTVIHRAGKMGLGTAYKLGFQQAVRTGADFVVQMDVDGSHDPRAIIDMLKVLNEADIAVGSRYVAGGGVDRDWGWYRRIISKGANYYSRAVLGLTQHDLTNGYKCYRRQVLEKVPVNRVKSKGYLFQIEMAYLCNKYGFKTVEVPIQFLPRLAGRSKLSWKVILEVFWRVWQIRFQDYSRD